MKPLNGEHQKVSASSQPSARVSVFHIDGAGSRPDGTGSGFAWICLDSGRQRVKRVDGLTNNEAEYRALISVLRNEAPGSRALIYTDSQLLYGQFSGQYAVRVSRLGDLLSWARELIREQELEVELRWIPRERNLAGKLLVRR